MGIERTVFIGAAIACLSLLSTAAPDQHGKRVLALFEFPAYSSTYSQYLDSLKREGYSIVEKSATDPNLHLREWDHWKYDKLIVFASGIKAFGGALDSEAILDFVDAGHDLILAVDSRASDEIRNLASDLGVDLEPQGTAVIDTTNHVAMTKLLDTTLVMSWQLLQAPAIFGDAVIKEPILFRGLGASLARDSEQAIQVLSAEKTQFMANPAKAFSEEWQKVGTGISLVSVAQTRNDARVVIAGSMDAFSNTFLQARDVKTKQGEVFPGTGNEEFLRELTKWAFHERSVLKASNLRHRPPNDTAQPDRYRITDEVLFEVDIHEYAGGSWRPFKASDVQVEFTMLDPHVRAFLQHDGKGHFFTQFKIPDVYGVFKFVIDHKRLGYTPLRLSEQIQIRHFKHNEFERFIVAAYPYYTSAFSCMIASLIFSFVFLYHKD